MTNEPGSSKKTTDRIHAVISLGFANILINVVSGVFWFYLAALLGAQEYGRVSYLVAISSLTSIIASLGLGSTLIVSIAKKQELLTETSFVSIVSGLIFASILYFIFADVGVSLYIVGYVIFALASFELLGRKLYKDYSKYIIVQRILQVSLALLLYYLLGPKGVILGIALSFFPFLFKIYKGVKWSKINLKALQPRFRLIINSYVLELAKTFSFSADKIIILPMFGFVLLGNYQLGIQVLTALLLIPYTVYQYTLPQDASGNSNRKVQKLSMLVSVALAAIVIILAPVLLPLVLPQFSEAIFVVQIASLAIIPLSVNFIFFSKLLGGEQNRILMIGSGIFVSIQTLGIYVLGAMYGIAGAAVALVLGATAESIYFIVIDRLKLNKKDQKMEP